MNDENIKFETIVTEMANLPTDSGFVHYVSCISEGLVCGCMHDSTQPNVWNQKLEESLDFRGNLLRYTKLPNPTDVYNGIVSVNHQKGVGEEDIEFDFKVIRSEPNAANQLTYTLQKTWRTKPKPDTYDEIVSNSLPNKTLAVTVTIPMKNNHDPNTPNVFQMAEWLLHKWSRKYQLCVMHNRYTRTQVD